MYLGSGLSHESTESSDEGDLSQSRKTRRVGETIHVARRVKSVRNRRNYYGFAMKFEPIANGTGTEVTFECIQALWFNIHKDDSKKHFWQSFWEQTPLPAVRVTLRTGPGITLVGNEVKFDATLNNIRASGKRPVPSVEENRWYKLSLLPDQGVPPRVEVEQLRDADDYELPEDVTLWRVNALTTGIEQALRRVFYIRPSKVQSLVGQPNAEVSFVGVLNVGQGGCNGVYGADGHPFLYFDFGRAKSRDSRPRSMRPCLANSPTIILSHWDQDHYELAASYPEAKHVPWICLPGPTGSNTGMFFDSLTHTRVRDEDDQKFEEYPWGFILKATDTHNTNNKNDAGLAALVRVQDDTDAPPVGQRRALDAAGTRPQIFPEERYVLLTGDAMCQFIPSCRHHDLDGKIIGISAVHHGSAVGMFGSEDSIPLAAPPLHNLPPTVAYTFGINTNTGQASGGYGHPHQHALDTYIRRGYYHRIETNTKRNAGPPWVTARNCVLGWKRTGPLPAGGAAAAITNARNAYDTAVTTAGNLRQFAADATGAAAIAVVAPLATGATVTAAVQLVASYAAVQADVDVVNLIAAASVATAAAAKLLFDAFPDQAMVRSHAVQANAANLVFEVANNDNDFPDSQTVRCQGGYNAVALSNPACLACTPGVAPSTAACAHAALPVAVNALCPAVETPGRTIVTLISHGIPNNDRVDADIYVNQQVQVLDEDRFQINATTGAPFRRNCEVTYLAPPNQRLNCTITDQGAPITIVNHDAHYIVRGTQVTLSNASQHALILNQAHPTTEINAGAYSIGNNRLTQPGLSGITALAAGRRQSRKVSVTVTITDDGAGNVTVHEPNHAIGANGTTKRIEVQQTTNVVHSGDHFMATVADANHYGYVVPALQAVAIANDPAQVTYRTAEAAFNNEPVTVGSSGSVSVVRHPHHGMVDDDIVTITGAATAVFNGTHSIVKKTDNEYIIPVGTGTGTVNQCTSNARPNGCSRFPATIEDTGNHLVITHLGHGFDTGSYVQLACAARPAYNGWHQIQKINNNSYRVNLFIGAGNAAVQVQVTGVRGASEYRNENVTLTGNLGATVVTVEHRNHGLRTGANVTIASVPVNGTTAVTVTGPNHYTINVNPALAANIAAVAGTASGMRASTGAAPHEPTAHNNAVFVRKSVLASIKGSIDKVRRAQAAGAAVERWRNMTVNATCASACAFRWLDRRI